MRIALEVQLDWKFGGFINGRKEWVCKSKWDEPEVEMVTEQPIAAGKAMLGGEVSTWVMVISVSIVNAILGGSLEFLGSDFATVY